METSNTALSAVSIHAGDTRVSEIKNSFITYRNVTTNLEEAGRDLTDYLATLTRKQK